MKKLITLMSLLTLVTNNYIQSMEICLPKFNTSDDIAINNFYEENIQPFLTLKQCCKTLDRCITFKMISQLACEDIEFTEKDVLLQKIITLIKIDDNMTFLSAIATLLVRAGANPNIMYMGESFLHKALLMNAKPLIKALLKHGADYADKHYLIGPIFFNAPTKEIAQLFIDKGINVNMTNDNGHNILWHLIDSNFPVGLVHFYLQHKVDVTHICPWDGTCILHSFAASNDIKNEANFLTKAYLILRTNPTMLKTLDNNKETPMTVAKKTIEYWAERHPSCINPLSKLIDLFNKYEKMTKPFQKKKHAV